MSLPTGSRLNWQMILAVVVGLLAAPILMIPAVEDEDQVFEWTADLQAKIERLFAASDVTFNDDGTVTLTYDFESKSDALLDDFSPPMAKFKGRLRWSRGDEGTFSTVENGLVMSMSGTWQHTASVE